MSNVLRLSSRLSSCVSCPAPASRLGSLVSRSGGALGDRPLPSRPLRAALALALLTSYFAFFTSSALAEEWGFSFSGQILEVVDGEKSVAKQGGSANYEADVYIRLYDDSEATQTAKTGALWGRKIRVSAKNGNFSCELRDSAGGVLTAAYTNLQDAVAHLGGSTATVGVTPFSDMNAEIEPRQQLSSVTFAVNAGDALGSNGDISIPGTLATGAAEASSVAFKCAVTHAGEVTFESDPKFPSLTLRENEPLVASRLAVETDVAVSEIAADRLAAAEATVAVSDIRSGVVSNLTVKGEATVADAKDASGKLTVDGNVAVKNTLATKNIVLGGGADLFRWENEIVKLDSSSGESTSHYTDTGSGGYWTVPESVTGHLLMSLNYEMNDGGSITVKLDGATVGELSTGKSGWMSLQVIVPPGKKIEWSGSAKTTEIYYRKFRY